MGSFNPFKKLSNKNKIAKSTSQPEKVDNQINLENQPVKVVKKSVKPKASEPVAKVTKHKTKALKNIK